VSNCPSIAFLASSTRLLPAEQVQQHEHTLVHSEALAEADYTPAQ
jgi:hypothetical protein